MTINKGYIEIKNIPKDCIECYFEINGGCFLDDREASPIPEYRPDWCPIKEHELWKCAQKHKEEMLAFHGGQRNKDAP